jgi:Uma2 family endonuclease
MPATAVSVSVEEYLETVYRPDCDYVDGEIVERNVGEYDHGRLQTLLSYYLVGHEKLWGITAVTELRVQVKPTRFRVPDITVIANPVPHPAPEIRILREPPLLCVEILSPEDRMVKVQEVVEDYLGFGVPCVWVINPITPRGFVYTPDGMVEAKDGVLRVSGTSIEVPLAELV